MIASMGRYGNGVMFLCLWESNHDSSPADSREVISTAKCARVSGTRCVENPVKDHVLMLTQSAE